MGLVLLAVSNFDQASGEVAVWEVAVGIRLVVEDALNKVAEAHRSG